MRSTGHIVDEAVNDYIRAVHRARAARAVAEAPNGDVWDHDAANAETRCVSHAAKNLMAAEMRHAEATHQPIGARLAQVRALMAEPD